MLLYTQRKKINKSLREIKITQEQLNTIIIGIFATAIFIMTYLIYVFLE